MTRQRPITDVDYRPIPEVSAVVRARVTSLVESYCGSDPSVLAMLFAPLSPAVGRGTLTPDRRWGRKS